MRSLVILLAFYFTLAVSFKAGASTDKSVEPAEKSADQPVEASESKEDEQSKAASQVRNSGSPLAAEAGDPAQTIRNAQVVEGVKSAAGKVKSEVGHASPAVKSDLRFLGFVICVAALLGVFVYLVNI